MLMKGKFITREGASDAASKQVLDDVAFLHEVLARGEGEARAPAPSQAILVALSGLPGTGKSHFARELNRRVPSVVLESERLRKLLVPYPRYTPSEHARVFNACHVLIEEFLSQGRRVTFDATNLTESFRGPLYRICDKLSVPLILVRFTAPRDVVRRRLEERAEGLHHDNYSDADWLVYCRLSPYEEPVGRPHHTVDSSTDVSAAVEEVARLVTSVK